MSKSPPRGWFWAQWGGGKGEEMKHQTPSESPKAVGGSWRPRSGHLPPATRAYRGTILMMIGTLRMMKMTKMMKMMLDLLWWKKGYRGL